MDKRKLSGGEFSDEGLTIHDILNSRKVNEALLLNAEEMFHLEADLKLKAQLRYMEEKQKKQQRRMKFFNYLSHEFLWSPTPVYYFVTLLFFIVIKKRYSLKPYTIIPFMAIPVTMDYAKREFYVSSFKEEKSKLTKVRRSV